jgi:uncharacterized protein
MIFFAIALSIPVLAAVWWCWADRSLRRQRSRWGRPAVGVFSLTILLTYAWLIAHRFDTVSWPPFPVLLALLMLWGMIFLPFLAVPAMGAWGLWRIWDAVRGLYRPPAAAGATGSDPAGSGAESSTGDGASSDAAPEPPLSRREWIERSLVTVPMLVTLGTTAYSVPHKRTFRVRHLHVDVPGLPEKLEGLRIAHVSDVHVGKFTRGSVLERIAFETNRLEPDLILLTGDLIDYTINDLPEALTMIDRMRPRERIVTIEGNHDLFDGRDAFADGVRERDIPLLLDESRTLQVRGFPVQILGIRWHFRGQPIAPHVDRVAELRDPEAFPILLAHHPHAFDRAAEHRLPLTLAGHTHGGQLMLTSEVGAGPMLFKYVSGEYRRGESRLVVSNGVGNWFPLRTNAPAEILHLTLHRAGPAPALGGGPDAAG